MKIFHTADWHLGKLVHGVSMTDDQRHVLTQFIEAVETEKPDVVIVAGDLFDRAVAPVEAVNLLNDNGILLCETDDTEPRPEAVEQIRRYLALQEIMIVRGVLILRVNSCGQVVYI